MKYSLSFILLFVSFYAQSQVYQWTKTFGDETYSYASVIKADTQGNTYSFGSVQGTVDVDPSAALYNITAQNYLLKLDSNGNFIWEKELSASTIISSIEIDHNGDLLLVGTFSGAQDFNFGSGQSFLYGDGFGDIFAVKLNANAGFIWGKSYGGTLDDGGSSVKCDSNNNVFVSGVIRYTVNFNPGAGNQTLTPSGGLNGFCLKLSAEGEFTWVNLILVREVRDTAVDSQGNIYLCGMKSNINDAYIKKLNPQGDEIWNYQLAGSSTGLIDLVEVDHNDNVIAAGTTSPGIDYNPSSEVSTLSPGAYKFIVKFDAAGNFSWVKGLQAQNCEDLTIDSNNYVYVSGDFSGQCYYFPDALTQTPCLYSAYNAQYIISLNAEGDYNWGTYQRNNGSSNIWSHLDVNGTNLYLTSTFNGTADFNPTGNHEYVTAAGPRSSYISKFNTATLSTPIYEQSSMRLLHNPVNELVQLSFDSEGHKELTVYSIQGVLLRNETVSGDYASLDASDLATGIYIIHCHSRFGEAKVKFVKR